MTTVSIIRLIIYVLAMGLVALAIRTARKVKPQSETGEIDWKGIKKLGYMALAFFILCLAVYFLPLR